MSSLLMTLAVLAGTAFALPSPSIATTLDSPKRILPFNWQFNITALDGPGCPDFGQTSPPYVTRGTFGSNTIDGTDIYYWHFAYPHLRASVGGKDGKTEDSVWCETTLLYTELNEQGKAPAKPRYRLKLHKNGTEMIASYDLDSSVEAKWRFIYYVNDNKSEEIVDEITVRGPVSSAEEDDFSPETALVQYALPACGTGTIKYRTELTLTAKKDGASGTVASEAIKYKGATEYYGAQQGVSYDWEKCTD